ncbi:MAG: DUF3078 domain-containing protein [Candidatus Kapabacteria bacterium]|nr:DUF3078 domain-containing protein [Candidatus Kapabacteria bacterium]
MPLILYSQAKFSLTFSQSLINDWQQGEKLAFELNNSFDFKHKFKIDTLILNASLKYAIGIQYLKNEKLHSALILPTDNDIFGEFQLSYPLGWRLDPFFSASIRTQITESFIIIKDSKKRTANLWDPVISMQSLGFAYSSSNPNVNLSFRCGVSFKQTRSDLHYQLTDDIKTKDIIEKYRAESGIEIKSELLMKFNELSSYNTSIELFSSFQKISSFTGRWVNSFQFKIWSYFGIIVNLDFTYDEKQMKRLQYKQNTRIGLITNL